MRRGRAALLFAFAMALVASTPRVSRAQAPAPDVKHAFEEAVDTEKRGEYENALERFKKIEAIKPTAGVLFHEAYCLEMLGKLAPAYEAYERAEKLARDTNKQDVLTAVQGRLGPLAKRVPLVNVTIEPANATLKVDGQPVTNTSVRVEPGDHDVSAEAPGYTTKKLRLQCREGTVQSITLTLVPANAPAAAPGPAPAGKTTPEQPAGSAPAPLTEPPREEAPKKSIALPVAATAGAVVFLAGGVVSFLLSGSAQSDAEKECPQKTSCEDEKRQVRTLDAVALTGFIAGAGLGALAVILWTGRSSGSAKVTASGTSLLLKGEF